MTLQQAPLPAAVLKGSLEITARLRFVSHCMHECIRTHTHVATAVPTFEEHLDFLIEHLLVTFPFRHPRLSIQCLLLQWHLSVLSGVHWRELR